MKLAKLLWIALVVVESHVECYYLHRRELLRGQGRECVGGSGGGWRAVGRGRGRQGRVDRKVARQ